MTTCYKVQERLQSMDKAGIPNNIVQVMFCFKSYKVLLHAVLGPDHVLTRKFNRCGAQVRYC
jgi:hypothetical protein